MNKPLTQVNGLPKYMTFKQVTEWMGWSKDTIKRKVKAGCFPIYPFSSQDKRLRAEDIIHYNEGLRQGGFGA